MTNLVEFPGLGLQFEVSRVAFTLFGAPVYWYGAIIGFGMLLAVIYAFSQCDNFGIDGDRMVDVILVGFVLAIIGGRLYFIFFEEGDYSTFRQIINLRGGGLAIYGGIIGAFIGLVLACRWRKVPTLPMADLAGMGFLIGQAIGRWGNFTNQEAFGHNTSLPWGMISPATTSYLTRNQEKLSAIGIYVDPYQPVHPTFLYESLWCALGFLLLHLYRKKRKFNGELFLMYIFWYGLGRFFIEGLRTDSLMTSGSTLRVSQALALVSSIAAFIVWIIIREKTKGKPLQVPVVLPHTANITFSDEEGEHTVEIQWPANGKVPRKEQQLLMAKDVWDKQQEEKEDAGPTKEDAKPQNNQDADSDADDQKDADSVETSGDQEKGQTKKEPEKTSETDAESEDATEKSSQNPSAKETGNTDASEDEESK